MAQDQLLSRAQAADLLAITYPAVSKRTWYNRLAREEAGEVKTTYGFTTKKVPGSTHLRYEREDVLSKAKALIDKNPRAYLGVTHSYQFGSATASGNPFAWATAR